MHQPMYRDGSGRYTAPWVRLHAVRDYLHMAQVLDRHPNVHVTVNFVPSLLEQLDEYCAGRAVDPELALSRQDAWTDEQKLVLLDKFFQVDERTVLSRYPAYARLKRVRDAAAGDVGLLSSGFFRDLTAWFNLAWIDAATIEQDRELSGLASKGDHFTHEDVQRILTIQGELMREVVPAYRHLAVAGQVELTTSPYYHPLMPLLYDTAIARDGAADLQLPSTGLQAPEDAWEQLRMALESHREHFGELPRGNWPPEGAVSAGLLPDLVRSGISWVASDEGVLSASLGQEVRRDGNGRVLNPDVLYRPYDIYAGRSRLSLVFRDRTLSDLIGFTYRYGDAGQAAHDMVDRLAGIAAQLGRGAGRALVVIALDGENCWDGYWRNGEDFLDQLYTLLEESWDLRAVTVSEHLKANPSRRVLQRLTPGTWLPNGFRTWIGEGRQNRAWDLLARTRADLIARVQSNGLSEEAVRAAWRQIYISEGSDWFWWLFHSNATEGRSPFDRLFCSQLRAVYDYIGQAPPGWLECSCGGVAENSGESQG